MNSFKFLKATLQVARFISRKNISTISSCCCTRNRMATSYMHRDDLKKMVFFRRKRRIRNIINNKEFLSVNCYGTADHYKFDHLLGNLKKHQNLLTIQLPMEVSDAALIKLNNKKFSADKNFDAYLFIFRFGVISYWNVSDNGIKSVNQLVKEFEVDSYKEKHVEYQAEKFNFKFVSGNTSLSKNFMDIQNSSDESAKCVDMYSLASSLAISVKLSHWELALDELIHSLEPLPNELINTRITKNTSNNVLRHIGEIFLLRHRVNLQHSSNSVPDVFWDNENLENIFLQASEYYDINKRIEEINKKLSYCSEMVELVKSHITEQKSYNVEVLIVLLIMLEVAIEVTHFVLNSRQKKKENQSLNQETN